MAKAEKNSTPEVEADPKPDTVTLTVGELLTIAGMGWQLVHRARLAPGAVMEVRRVMDAIVKPKLAKELTEKLEQMLHRGEADDSLAAVRKLMGEGVTASAT